MFFPRTTFDLPPRLDYFVIIYIPLRHQLFSNINTLSMCVFLLFTIHHLRTPFLFRLVDRAQEGNSVMSSCIHFLVHSRPMTVKNDWSIRRVYLCAKRAMALTNTTILTVASVMISLENELQHGGIATLTCHEQQLQHPVLSRGLRTFLH